MTAPLKLSELVAARDNEMPGAATVLQSHEFDILIEIVQAALAWRNASIESDAKRDCRERLEDLLDKVQS